MSERLCPKCGAAAVPAERIAGAFSCPSCGAVFKPRAAPRPLRKPKRSQCRVCGEPRIGAAHRLRMLEQSIAHAQALSDAREPAAYSHIGAMALKQAIVENVPPMLVMLRYVLADDGRGWCLQCADKHAAELGTPSTAMGSGRR